jgi:hypothetical protein
MTRYELSQLRSIASRANDRDARSLACKLAKLSNLADFIPGLGKINDCHRKMRCGKHWSGPKKSANSLLLNKSRRGDYAYTRSREHVGAKRVVSEGSRDPHPHRHLFRNILGEEL